jgi:PelA/Pel-15E family pectate lyase
MALPLIRSLVTATLLLAACPLVAQQRDLAYGTAGDVSLLLDAYPAAGEGNAPVVILVHGGGWASGDKAGDLAPLAAPLSAAGFTVFSINYRLAPEHRWPACLQDVLTAVRWAKANAAAHKGDPTRIALIGYSAGGHLATYAAKVVDDSARVQAVVGLAPLTDFVQELPQRGNILGRTQRGLLNRPEEITPESLGLLKALSPINHLRPGLPPFLLMHGSSDESVPYIQSVTFQSRLHEHGVRADLIPLPGAPHALAAWNDFVPSYQAQLVSWLRGTLGVAVAATPAPKHTPWGPGYLTYPPEWYGSAEARAVADSVIRYQSVYGGWPKSTDLAQPPETPDDIPPNGRGRANSFDNDATTLPMEFLARVITATGEERYRASFLRGVDYLFAAQYPNGGWPQFWPLRGDEYYSRITYNDGAMVRVLLVLRGVASGEAPYAFVDPERRTLAAAAVQRGIDCILKTQIREGGKLTAWCAQHDERTLAPAWARAYEPPSLSGSESVDLVRFLMEVPAPTPEIRAAIEGAVSWLAAVPIQGQRLDRIRGADGRVERRLVPDPAAPRLWARFYELGTHRPLYLDRDSVFLYRYSEVGYERRSGYEYHGNWAETLLSRDYPTWRARHRLP